MYVAGFSPRETRRLNLSQLTSTVLTSKKGLGIIPICVGIVKGISFSAKGIQVGGLPKIPQKKIGGSSLPGKINTDSHVNSYVRRDD